MPRKTSKFLLGFYEILWFSAKNFKFFDKEGGDTGGRIEELVE